MTRRSIDLKVQPEFLAALFWLDPSMRVVGARTEHHDDYDLLVFAIDAPDAPPGTVEMFPVYRRVNNDPDPVELVSVDWIGRDGTRSVQYFREPTPAPVVTREEGLAKLREAHAAYRARKAAADDTGLDQGRGEQ